MPRRYPSLTLDDAKPMVRAASRRHAPRRRLQHRGRRCRRPSHRVRPPGRSAGRQHRSRHRQGGDGAGVRQADFATGRARPARGAAVRDSGNQLGADRHLRRRAASHVNGSVVGAVGASAGNGRTGHRCRRSGDRRLPDWDGSQSRPVTVWNAQAAAVMRKALNGRAVLRHLLSGWFRPVARDESGRAERDRGPGTAGPMGRTRSNGGWARAAWASSTRRTTGG